MAVTNGAVPDALLVYADGTQRLRIGTAGRWSWVRAQVAARFGWTPQIISGGGYRSVQQQVAIFTARYVQSATGSGPFGDVRWWNGVRYIRTSPAGAAAVPGTSNHGYGTAVDVVGLLSFTSTQRDQFAQVAAQASFSDAEGRAAGEPWHWVDQANPDVITVSNTTTTGGVLPNAPGSLTATAPEDDMTPDQSAKLDALYATLTPGQAGVKPAGDIVLQLARIEADAHTAADAVTPGQAGVRQAGGVIQGLASISAAIAALAGKPSTLDPGDLAAAIAQAVPADLAKAVADELAKRLAS